MLNIIFYILACLLIPIAWGVIVNWLFVRWEKSKRTPRESKFPDYQI